MPRIQNLRNAVPSRLAQELADDRTFVEPPHASRIQKAIVEAETNAHSFLGQDYVNHDVTTECFTFLPRFLRSGEKEYPTVA